MIESLSIRPEMFVYLADPSASPRPESACFAYVQEFFLASYYIVPALRSPEAVRKMERRVRFRRIYLPRRRIGPRSISLEFSRSPSGVPSREVIERGELGTSQF